MQRGEKLAAEPCEYPNDRLDAGILHEGPGEIRSERAISQRQPPPALLANHLQFPGGCLDGPPAAGIGSSGPGSTVSPFPASGRCGCRISSVFSIVAPGTVRACVMASQLPVHGIGAAERVTRSASAGYRSVIARCVCRCTNAGFAVPLDSELRGLRVGWLGVARVGCRWRRACWMSAHPTAALASSASSRRELRIRVRVAGRIRKWREAGSRNRESARGANAPARRLALIQESVRRSVRSPRDPRGAPR